jgi:sulfopyruvate decarboxylase alpha subunit
VHWAEIALAALKASGVDTLVYVPDIILHEILRRAETDGVVRLVPMPREEDGVGVVCGLYLGGRRAALLMQNSGLGNAANALASLAVPYEIPLLMLISQRGGLGEWNPVQVPMQLAARPLFDSLGIPHYTVTAPDDLDRVIRGAAKLAYDTGRGVAVILDSRLTGGNRG